MFKTKNRLISALAGLVLLSASANAAANVNFGVNIGISAPPPPPAHVVVVAPPQGYNSCYVTEGMWLNDVWVPPHQQCSYAGPSGPHVWVSGYWGCVNVGPGGRCGQWRWYNHHVIRRDVVYNRPYHSVHGYAEAPAHYRYQEFNEGPHYGGGPVPDGPSYGHGSY